MQIPLNERIYQIVRGHSGIKASRLCANLSVEYLSMTGVDIRAYLIHMVDTGDLYEIEYTLPDGRNESIILEKGSILRGTSK